MKKVLNSRETLKGLKFESFMEISELKSALKRQLDFYEVYCNLNPVEYPATYEAYTATKNMCAVLGI